MFPIHKGQIVKVVWLDAVMTTGKTFQSVRAEPELVQSVGILLKEWSEGKDISMAGDYLDATYTRRELAIPTGMVKTVEVLYTETAIVDSL